MMTKLLAALGLAFALSSFPAMAQTDADTDAAIDSALGDHTFYRTAFDALQKAIADDDKAGFAAWVSYPIAVTADGEEMTIADAAQFEEHYDNILTDAIKTAISEQKWQDLFANYKGVMFGNGQVWLNGICKDDTCAEFDVKVVTIQSTADITPKAN
jgi:hypothetical protein